MKPVYFVLPLALIAKHFVYPNAEVPIALAFIAFVYTLHSLFGHTIATFIDDRSNAQSALMKDALCAKKKAYDERIANARARVHATQCIPFIVEQTRTHIHGFSKMRNRLLHSLFYTSVHATCMHAHTIMVEHSRECKQTIVQSVSQNLRTCVNSECVESLRTTTYSVGKWPSG